MTIHNNRFDELESIRGIASMLVVVFHVPKWHGLFVGPGVQNLYLMVDLFFVLSGFVIFRAYGQRIHTPSDLGRFQFLRLGRLYPVHLVFLLLFAVLELARYTALARNPSLGLQPVATQNTPAAFLQNLFLAQMLVPGEPLTFNGVSWSISAEFYTYLIFGLALILTRRAALYVFCALTISALLALQTGHTAGLDKLIRCFAGFFLGCITAKLYEVKPDRTLPSFSPALAILAFAAYLIWKPSARADVWVYGIAAGLVLCVVRAKDGFMCSLLRSKILVELGALSYAVYMSHPFLIWLFEMSMKYLLHKPASTTVDGGYIAALTLGEAVSVYLLFFAALLLVSAAVCRLIETPVRKWSRRVVAETRSRGAVIAYGSE